MNLDFSISACGSDPSAGQHLVFPAGIDYDARAVADHGLGLFKGDHGSRIPVGEQTVKAVQGRERFHGRGGSVLSTFPVRA